FEVVEHLRDRPRGQVDLLCELARGELARACEPEEQPVLRVADLSRSMRLAAAQLPHRDHRAFERHAELSRRGRRVEQRTLCFSRAHARASATAPESSARRSGSFAPAARAALRALDSARMRTMHGTTARSASPTDHQNAVPYACAAAALVCA